VSVVIYVEGGGGTNDLRRRCRDAFTRLLINCGYQERAFKIVACGPRNEAFKQFRLRFKNGQAENYIALWIDSEEPVADINKTWKHLATRDSSWIKPRAATDEQVLFMTTCMETLIAADRDTLKKHYGSRFKLNKLPPLARLEERRRDAILMALIQASGDKYEKGEESFRILAKLNPETLQSHLPSFHRTRQILNTVLPQNASPI